MNIAIILMGGESLRTKSSLPKQYVKIKGKEVFLYSFLTFYKNKNIHEIILVIQKEFFKKVSNILKMYDDKKIILVEAGKARQQSSFNALNFINQNYDNKNINVLIHDAARPLIDDEIINEIIKKLKSKKAVTTYLPNSDTLCKEKNHKLQKYEDRNSICKIQTPQGFKFDTIYKAHLNAKKKQIKNVSDDTQLVYKIKEEIYFVKGNKFNFKVTFKEDLKLLEKLI